MKSKTALCFLLFFALKINHTTAQGLYFPPLTGPNWNTVSPAALGWCTQYIDTLNNLLQLRNTKAFILLKDGKIAHEIYFGTFTADSFWYWASAGKTLSAFVTGQAQEQGFLNINNPVSGYLGTGWTGAPAAKEALITVRHQLTMTTGLDDGVPNPDCTSPACLLYFADAGSRWAYHNAPYTLLHDVIDSATGNFTAFFNSQLRNRIGMNGLWLPVDFFNRIYFSSARSMARFGLLLLSNGIWNNDTLIHDSALFSQMINSSQNLNLSYGFLTWLNGKSSFMLPGSQLVFPFSIIPNAPPDLYCALGKNDQKIHIVPSLNLVMIRMGNAADSTALVPVQLDYEIWEVLNKLFCISSIEENYNQAPLTINNPFTDELILTGVNHQDKMVIIAADGKTVWMGSAQETEIRIITKNWPAGLYLLRINERPYKLIKAH